MKYAKIIVKNNYEKRGDLVLRSYVRALKKIKAKLLLDNDNAFIYGKVDEEGRFHEWFTKEIIDFNHYENASVDEILGLSYLSLTKIDQIKKVIKYVIFNKNIDFDFEISAIEELATDRAIEFEAYNNFLSRINPYMRLGDNEDQNIYNAYNNFACKINEIKNMDAMNKKVIDYDGYDINNYYEEVRSDIDTDDKEYLIFDFSKKLIRK